MLSKLHFFYLQEIAALCLKIPQRRGFTDKVYSLWSSWWKPRRDKNAIPKKVTTENQRFSSILSVLLLRQYNFYFLEITQKHPFSSSYTKRGCLSGCFPTALLFFNTETFPSLPASYRNLPPSSGRLSGNPETFTEPPAGRRVFPKASPGFRQAFG